jgi:hypothetical protein
MCWSVQFEKEFLDVPQECLILTMKANQKYFPLLDDHGKLTNQFLVVSNISPTDASAVIGGNERVVRPRLADAKFFFDQDRKKTLSPVWTVCPKWCTTTSSAPRASVPIAWPTLPGVSSSSCATGHLALHRACQGRTRCTGQQGADRPPHWPRPIC